MFLLDMGFQEVSIYYEFSRQFQKIFLGEDPRKEEGKFSRKVFKEKKRGGSKIMDYPGDLLRSLLILSKFLV